LVVDKNKLYRVKTKSDKFNYSKVETSIQGLIKKTTNNKQTKVMLYCTVTMKSQFFILNEALKLIKGLNYYDSEEDFTSFLWPHSAIQPYIKIGKTCSLRELLETASSVTLDQIREVRLIVLNWLNLAKPC